MLQHGSRLFGSEKLGMQAYELLQQLFVKKENQALIGLVDRFGHQVKAPLDKQDIALAHMNFLRRTGEFFVTFQHHDNGMLFEKNVILRRVYFVTVSHEGHVLNLERLKFGRADIGRDP